MAGATRGGMRSGARARPLRAPASARRRRDGRGVQGARRRSGRLRARRGDQADPARLRPRRGLRPHVRRRGADPRPPAPPERRAGATSSARTTGRCSWRSSTSRARRCRASCGRCARANRRMPPAIAAYIAREICRALDCVHRAAGRQRARASTSFIATSRPRTSSLTPWGGVKLLDFGVAKFTSAAQVDARGDGEGQAGLSGARAAARASRSTGASICSRSAS